MLNDVRLMNERKIILVKPEDHLCEAECPVVRNGVWLFHDEGHLTVAGAEYFAARAPFESFILAK